MSDDDLFPETMSDWQVRVMAFLYLVIAVAVIWWFAVVPICHVLNQAPKFTCYWEVFIFGPAAVLLGVAPLSAGRSGVDFISSKTSWVSTCVFANEYWAGMCLVAVCIILTSTCLFFFWDAPDHCLTGVTYTSCFA